MKKTLFGILIVMIIGSIGSIAYDSGYSAAKAEKSQPKIFFGQGCADPKAELKCKTLNVLDTEYILFRT